MQSVLIRIIVYVLSSFLALAGAWLAGWGVSWDAASGVLSIHLETLASAIAGGLATSAAVFFRWGVR